jgi:Domain of unknown function (DUF4136)
MKWLESGFLAILVAGFTTLSLAQKVKVGYDNGADFSTYHTYTWAKPQMPATRPILYDYVVNTIDGQLEAKGLKKVEHDGDLTLVPAGGIEYGSNLPAGTPILPIYGGPPPDMNATMWTGAYPSAGSGPIVAQGSLTLEFVDRSQNKVIWNGTVTQKLDPTKKQKSVELVGKAIVKLLNGFPPKHR